MNKEEIKNYISELESMFELSELENHSRNILKVGIYIKQLQQENQELKKQLEEERNKVREYSYKLSNFRCEETYENQQKEFIEYLEDLIKQNETVVEVSKYGLPKNCSKLLIDFYKEILSKYKEIIGGK